MDKQRVLKTEYIRMGKNSSLKRVTISGSDLYALHYYKERGYRVIGSGEGVIILEKKLKRYISGEEPTNG